MARILIAEDDSSMRNFLSMALRRAGHEVELCPDGLTALRAIEGGIGRFDLLLSDIVMPGMDGIELSQKATKTDPALKIMFITGFAAVAMDKKDMIEDQHAKVIPKPFHLKDLVDQIEQILAA